MSESDKPVARVMPKSGSSLTGPQSAVAGLRALRRRIKRRKGFKPLTDKEIRDSVDNGRA